NSYLSVFFCFSCSVLLRLLHSFPTRRSSDLSIGHSRAFDDDRRGAYQAREPRPGVLQTDALRLQQRTGTRDQVPHHVHAYDRSRSEEHTSELQSPCNLVCRLLLEKKKKIKK